MKKLLFLILFISSNLFAQELKYSDLNSDTRPNGQVKSYLSKDGIVYKVGDRLKIGFPSSENNKKFQYITNKLDDGVNILGFVESIIFNNTATINTPPVKFTTKNCPPNTEIEIKSIGILVKGGNKHKVFLACFNVDDTYYIALEDAIVSGEIKPPEPTSDEALSELKKAKGKLDIGLITREQYDSIKTVLIKYIK